MTTPTGTIKLSDVRLEIYNSAVGQISMSDSNVRALAGVGSTGSVSMSQLKGKSFFNPNRGTSLGATSVNGGSVTVSCVAAVTFSKTGGGTATITSTSIQIDFFTQQVTPQGQFPSPDDPYAAGSASGTITAKIGATTVGTWNYTITATGG